MAFKLRFVYFYHDLSSIIWNIFKIFSMKICQVRKHVYSNMCFVILQSILPRRCPYWEFSWFVNLHIQSECGKIQIRKTPDAEIFRTVQLFHWFCLIRKHWLENEKSSVCQNVCFSLCSAGDDDKFHWFNDRWTYYGTDAAWF